MQIKRIKCPSCGVIITLKNSGNATEKIIACPKCGVKLKVKFKPVLAPQEPIEAHTYLGPQNAKPKPQQNSFETQLGGTGASKGYSSSSAETRFSSGGSSFETQLGASAKHQFATSKNDSYGVKDKSCCLIYNGGEIHLSVGRNIIGRHATTSQANVQIPTDDHYMSRQHCCIDITALPNGSIKAVLRNFHNKNVTYINGQAIGGCDIIRLSDGDTIRMGNTTITFKLL